MISLFRFFVYLLGVVVLSPAQAQKLCPLIPTPEVINSLVKNVNVPVKRLHLNTADNKTITLELRDRAIDLLGFKALGKGLEFSVASLDANGAPLEGTVTITSMDLETYARGHSEVTTAGGPLCHFKIPHAIEIRLPQPVVVITNTVYLIKLAMPASELLHFKPSGTPCKEHQLKCDLNPLNAASVHRMMDEF